MKSVTIHLFQLDELPEKSRERAIEEHRTFLLSEMRPEDFITGDPQYDTPEQLKKAYDAEYMWYEWENEPIIDSIYANEYWFFFDGSIANCTTCAAGENKGKTVFRFAGETDTFWEDEQ